MLSGDVAVPWGGGCPEGGRGSERARGSGRRSAPDSSAALRYLAVAEEIAAGDTGPRAFVHSVSSVTMAAAAARAGIDRTALYRMWPSQEDFWVDLIDHIFDHPRSVVPLVAMPRLADASCSIQRSAVDDARSTLAATLNAYVLPEGLARRVSGSVRQDIDVLTAWVGGALADAGRVPKAPFTVRDLGCGVYCMIGGLGKAGRFLDRATRADVVLDGRKTMLGEVAVMAIITRCSEPGAVPLATGESPVEQQRGTVAVDSTPKLAALEAGRQLYVESLTGGIDTGRGTRSGPLAHVTIERVARRAGVSRQAVQKIWAAQDDLLVELVAHLRQRESTAMREITRRGLSMAAVHRGPSPFAAAIGCVLDDLIAREASRRPLHLAALAYGRAPRVRHAVSSRISTMIEQFAADLEVVGRHLDRSPRAGISYWHLALLVAEASLAATRVLRADPAEIRSVGRHPVLAHVIASVLDDNLEPSAEQRSSRDRQHCGR